MDSLERDTYICYTAEMSYENTAGTHQFAWAENAPHKPEDYLPPNYYDELLKEYSFSGRSDLELLDDYLETIPTNASMLELGCGSGRATDQLLEKVDQLKSLDLVDLSEGMVNHCRAKYKDLAKVNVHQSDSVDFLSNTEQTFSSVVSLWNLSHSVHQHMFRLNRQEGSRHAENALGKFIVNRLETGGSMYLIHYDIQSPEQRLINPWRLSLWSEADPNYDASDQSPSKELLDNLFSDLHGAGYIDATVDHLEGDPIEYANKDTALETFLNFHMEGHFNRRPEFKQVVESLLKGFESYTDSDGTVRIAPGAFIYQMTRTDKPAVE